MKTLTLSALFIVLLSSSVLCQDRKDGKQVVAVGFEDSDSIRFALLRPYDVGYWQLNNYSQVDSLIDSIQCSAVENFDLPIQPSSHAGSADQCNPE